LRLHGVLAGTNEHFDVQMLVDSLEEQFHLPALTIEVGDQLGLETEVVGQKNHALARGAIPTEPLSQYADQPGSAALSRS
jgi:hypothetical protein